MTATSEPNVPEMAEALRRAEAKIAQWTWKNDDMKAMTLAVGRLALAKGAQPFSALDLPKFAHGGGGIAGGVFSQMAKDDLITPVGQVINGTFQQFTVANRGGNRIGLWRLGKARLVNRLLEVHGAAKPPRLVQVDLMTV